MTVFQFQRFSPTNSSLFWEKNSKRKWEVVLRYLPNRIQSNFCVFWLGRAENKKWKLVETREWHWQIIVKMVKAIWKYRVQTRRNADHSVKDKSSDGVKDVWRLKDYPRQSILSSFPWKLGKFEKFNEQVNKTLLEKMIDYTVIKIVILNFSFFGTFVPEVSGPNKAVVQSQSQKYTSQWPSISDSGPK